MNLPVHETAEEAQAAEAAMQSFNNDIARRTDHAFAVLMLLQWAAMVAVALWVTPRTWVGASSSVDPYVWIAIFVGGIISVVPAVLAKFAPGERVTRHVIAVGQMLTSSLLIHLTGGRIETHFHIFGSLSFLAFYLDWSVLLTASAVVLIDHLVRGIYWPSSIFGVWNVEPWRWVEHAGWIVFCDVFLVISCIDRLRKLRVIAVQQAKQETLLRKAYTDALTGLPNRAAYQAEVDCLLAERTATQKQFAVMYIDLDKFKEVNDQMGHAVGDFVLREASTRIARCMPPGAQLCRVGGDEYVALLPDLDTGCDLRDICQEILTVLLLPIERDVQQISLGASIGISLFPEHGANETDLLHAADLAMYSVKRQGRRGFQFYEPDCPNQVAEQRLRAAIDADEFEMHYQPLVGANGRVESLEALVRWRSPERGIVPPMEFIPLAEATGLIVPLGKLVFEKVLQQAVAWRAEELVFGSIAVNVSPQQLEREDFIRHIDAAFRKHELPTEYICVEITETACVSTNDTVAHHVRMLQQRGIRILIDDFGTGYSSLSRLQDMSFDVVKIDRMFISRMSTSATGCQVVETIIVLAHALGMTVVAEGVETAAQYALLQRLACDTIQGFYISKPLAIDDATAYLQRSMRASQPAIRPVLPLPSPVVPGVSPRGAMGTSVAVAQPAVQISLQPGTRSS